MERKDKRTYESYVRAGAMVRLLKELIAVAPCDVAKIVPLREADSFYSKCEGAIQRVSCIADDNLFSDFPDKENNEHVFYGSLWLDRTDETEKIVISEVLKILKELENKIKKGA